VTFIRDKTNALEFSGIVLIVGGILILVLAR